CGVEPPSHMHGRTFMGKNRAEAPEYQFGFRGRMDERYDLVRTCRDQQYQYIRNYMPHEVYGQYIDYMFQTPTTRVWKKLFDEGKLNEAQSRFWQKKPPEELYDLANDPDEVNNLTESPEHQDALKRMRGALRSQLLAWRDLGFLPEGQIHSRAGDDAPWTMGQDESRYPMEKILAMAEAASSLEEKAIPSLVEGLDASDSAVRYWAAMGLLMRGDPAVAQTREALQNALEDEAPAVRVVAAEALARFGTESDEREALELLIKHSDLRKHDTFTVMLALNAVQAMGDDAAPAKEQIASLPDKVRDMPPRAEGYVSRLLSKLREDFGAAKSR
ncbi:MAG: HEAT repeat domain-containing protein, partial [Planctomycetes bacterium]|nr:HEAT repeat domain-containing protein [Planctomycetota bacterium]